MSKKSRIIALDTFGTTFMEDYRIKAYRGVIRYAREHTNWRLVFNERSLSLAYRFREYRDMIDMGVDGLIFYAQSTEACKHARNMNLPAVDIAGATNSSGFPCIMADNLEIGRMGARHFLERGFRHFAFCAQSNVQWSTLRAEGFCQALKKEGFNPILFSREAEFDPEYHYSTEFKPKSRWATASELREWVRSLPKPIGIMGCQDQRALHVLEACRAEGIKVPNEAAILGVDNNTLLCESCIPSLSSIEQNAEQIGYEAAALLDRLLSGKNHGDTPVIVPVREIVTRMSTDVLAVDDPAISKSLLYISEHLSKPFGIPDVVRVSGVSRSNLERRFRERLGYTMMNEVRRRRIEKAKSLLLDTNLSLKTIAESSGFRRVTYLTNVFTEQVGMAPGQWRRIHRKTG